MKFRVEVVTHLTTPRWLEVFELWNSLFPEAIALESPGALERSIASHPNTHHYLALDPADEVIGWLAVYDRYAVRWFSILVHPRGQGASVGKSLLTEARRREPHLSGWAIADDSLPVRGGRFYKSVLGFYRKLDFEVLQPERWPAEAAVTLPVALVTWSAGEPVRPDFSVRQSS